MAEYSCFSMAKLTLYLHLPIYKLNKDSMRSFWVRNVCAVRHKAQNSKHTGAKRVSIIGDIQAILERSIGGGSNNSCVLR